MRLINVILLAFISLLLVGSITSYCNHKILGNLTVNENINATGNITAENVHLPTYLFVHTNDTINVASAGVWYNVTYGYSGGLKNFINHTYNDETNNTVTITEDGIYEIHFTLIFSDSSANPTANVVGRVVKNGSEIEGSLIEIDTTKQNAEVEMYNSILVSAEAGDEIRVQFTSDQTTVSLQTDATYGEHYDSSVLKVVRL